MGSDLKVELDNTGEQIENGNRDLQAIISEIQKRSSDSNFPELMDVIKYILWPSLNDLSVEEINTN